MCPAGIRQVVWNISLSKLPAQYLFLGHNDDDQIIDNKGIGYETAKNLAQRGAKVIMACRDIEKAKKAAKVSRLHISFFSLSVFQISKFHFQNTNAAI